MNNYKKKFIFEMRTKFKELKAIFPLVNNMILNGCTCDVTLKLPNKTEYNNACYIKICIFKPNSIFPCLTIRRNLENMSGICWEINSELKDIRENEYIFFELDDTYKNILLYIGKDVPKKDLLTNSEIYELFNESSVNVNSRKEKLDSNKFTLLYNLDFSLRADFSELVYLFSILNLMIYEDAYHFIQMKSRNLQDTSSADFKLKLYYEAQNRPSISITAKLKEISSKQQISIYNFLTLTYSNPMLFNLNYSEKRVSLQAYCNEDFISGANKLIETVFFPT